MRRGGEIGGFFGQLRRCYAKVCYAKELVDGGRQCPELETQDLETGE